MNAWDITLAGHLRNRHGDTGTDDPPIDIAAEVHTMPDRQVPVDVMPLCCWERGPPPGLPSCPIGACGMAAFCVKMRCTTSGIACNAGERVTEQTWLNGS